MILFNFSSPGGASVISTGGRSFDQCSVCSQASYYKPYADFPLRISIPKKINSWPHFLGDIHYTVVDNTVKTILENCVTGCRFYPLTKLLPPIDAGPGGGLPDWLPEPPRYFLLEPVGTIDFEVPKDEVTECRVCGLVKKNEFGDFKKPLIPMLSEWDGSDLMRPKRVYSHAMIVTPKFINVLRGHGLHRQLWYGLRNQITEAIYFGNRAVPGVSAQNLDSDTWYEDTLVAINEKFPECSL